ncbi:hypothetical protein ScPMuIL_007304, partial [Solemya velum]
KHKSPTKTQGRNSKSITNKSRLIRFKGLRPGSHEYSENVNRHRRAPPIKNRPYRAPLNKRRRIDAAIDEMLEAGIIEKSRSPWSFPIVMVKRKDGSDRFCVDYRTLNRVIKPTSFPLPLIDDILSLLDKSNCFTTLDLKSGYWQVQVDPESKEKTAFTSHKGLFHFNVMPFGINSSPGVFQELMNEVLVGCEDFAIGYLDDILIFSKNSREHMEHLKTVFQRLREDGLKLKLKKRFIPNFSEIAIPLVNLTKKYAKFRWTEACQKAFDYLKESLTVIPLLTYPSTSKPYILYTDASDR